MGIIKTMTEQVYDYIVDKILSEEYPPGMKLVETELVEKLDVSRTPVHEALLQLVADNLVEMRPRKGFFVRIYDHEAWIMDYEIIAIFDSFIANALMDKMMQSDYDLLRKYIEEMDHAINTQNNSLYNETQKKFHDAYLEKYPNKRLLALMHTLINGAGPAFVIKDTPSLTIDAQFYNNQHKALLKAFMDKDAELLNDVIWDHWVRDNEETRAKYLKYHDL